MAMGACYLNWSGTSSHTEKFRRGFPKEVKAELNLERRVGVSLEQKVGIGNEEGRKDILGRSNSIRRVGGVRDMGQERQCVNIACGFWEASS